MELPATEPTQDSASDGSSSGEESPPSAGVSALRVPVATATASTSAVGGALETIEEGQEGDHPQNPDSPAASPPSAARPSTDAAVKDPTPLSAGGAAVVPELGAAAEGHAPGREQESESSDGVDAEIEEGEGPTLGEPSKEERVEVETMFEQQQSGSESDGQVTPWTTAWKQPLCLPLLFQMRLCSERTAQGFLVNMQPQQGSTHHILRVTTHPVLPPRLASHRWLTPSAAQTAYRDFIQAALCLILPMLMGTL